MEFNKNEVYMQNITHRAVPNFSGSSTDKNQEFYNGIKTYFQTLNLDNIQLTDETINIGGGMFSSNGVPALGISYKKGKLKKLSAFFLITNTGNIFNFSIYKQASLGFLDVLVGVNSADKVSLIQSKLKTIEEVEEFSVFNAVADMLYEQGIQSTQF